MIDQVGEPNVFYKLELHALFHQIRVFNEHVECTAFNTRYGTFVYKVMPFGLCYAPSTFQRTMDYLLPNRRDFAREYIDDIVVYSANMDEHVEHLMEFHAILRTEKLLVNHQKCFYGQPEVEYCGFILVKYGVKPQPEKLMAIHKWPTPTSVSEFRSFLVLCNFYQRFAQVIPPSQPQSQTWKRMT